MKRVAPFVALILVLGRAASAFAADPRYPDWPCNQIKVPELSVAAIWTGPPIDDVGDTWERDPQIKDLVVRLAARRTPLDDAEKTIGNFLAASAQDKQTRAKLLFAGLFATLNRERTVVMNGIERFAQRRALVADRIKSEARQMRELQDAPNRDEFEGERADQQHRMGYARFRRPAEDYQLRLRGSDHHRAAAGRARACDPAVD